MCHIKCGNADEYDGHGHILHDGNDLNSDDKYCDMRWGKSQLPEDAEGAIDVLSDQKKSKDISLWSTTININN